MQMDITRGCMQEVVVASVMVDVCLSCGVCSKMEVICPTAGMDFLSGMHIKHPCRDDFIGAILCHNTYSWTAMIGLAEI